MSKAEPGPPGGGSFQLGLSCSGQGGALCRAVQPHPPLCSHLNDWARVCPPPPPGGSVPPAPESAGCGVHAWLLRSLAAEALPAPCALRLRGTLPGTTRQGETCLGLLCSAEAQAGARGSLSRLGWVQAWAGALATSSAQALITSHGPRSGQVRASPATTQEVRFSVRLPPRPGQLPWPLRPSGVCPGRAAALTCTGGQTSSEPSLGPKWQATLPAGFTWGHHLGTP